MERCRSCLYNSTVDVFRICPKRKQALLQYSDCILRYSNNNKAFSQVDTTPRGFYNVGKVSDADADHFNQQLSTLLNNLTRNAASKPTKFDSGRIDYKPLTPIEGFAQCTRDLSTTDCYSCLRNLMAFIPSCCDNSQGGFLYTTTCTIRYELYSFLQNPPQFFPPPFVASPPQSNVVPSPGAETSPTSNTVLSPGAETSPTQSNIVVILLLAFLLTWN
ncbi:Cysteine-rich repeat secretory protein [Thalictrum thalictroides]|uniref:Cysteine-rich repeat secretory protein n=1 Tax=Thalictrum thalictroides TaxID=46969 RepID=A0A7J6VGC6_THATH|nr:Cysteine-rich repeat secretory protein [Thalictrum thalictroides]